MVDPTYRYNVHFVFDRDCGGRGGEIEFGGSVMTDGKESVPVLVYPTSP